MTRRDWLVGAERRTEAVDRIYAAASKLVSEKGFEAFTIDALAARVHCSPATIYRHVGGKTAVIEGVMQQLSMRIVSRVHASIADLTGSQRIVTAIVVALELIRAEPLGPLMMGSMRPGQDRGWLTNSLLVNDLAEQMLGYDDPLAAQWLLRATLALWYWPVSDPADERECVERFIGPAFTGPLAATNPSSP